MAADAADPNLAGTVITLSSGASAPRLAGAKAAIRWLTGYAAEEPARVGLGIRFVSLLPQLTPVTDLVSGPGPDQDAYLLTGAGLRPL